MATDEKIFKKIKKLLTLASDNGATEAEAQTAMQRVHEILVKHNLSMDDVNAHKDDLGIIEGTFNDFAPTSWKQLIWDATSDLYFCRHMFARFVKRKGVRRYVYGKPENVQTAIQMALYFIKTVKKIADRECISISKSYKSEYLQGCAYRLATRMQEMKTPQEPSVSTSTSLVALYGENDRLINLFLKDEVIEEVDKYRKPNTSSEAFCRGWQRAGEIGLHQQITSESATSLAMSN